MAGKFSVEYIYQIRDKYSAVADRIKRSTDRMKKSFEGAGKKINDVSRNMRDFGAKGMLFATLPLALLSKNLISAASDAEETQSKFNVVFEGIGNDATKAAMKMAKEFNFSKIEALDLTAAIGDFTQNLGFSRKKSLDLSIGLNQLASDVASFKNVKGGAIQVSAAFQSALVGEREALKTLGVAMTEEDVKQRILLMRRRGVIFETKKQAKVLATIELLNKNFASSIGDVANTQNSHANTVRRYNATLSDLSVSFGSLLMPSATKAVRGLTVFVEAINNSHPAFKVLAISISVLIGVLMPLLFLIGGFVLMLPAIKVALIALQVPFILTYAAVFALVGAFIALGVALGKWVFKIESVRTAWKSLISDLKKETGFLNKLNDIFAKLAIGGVSLVNEELAAAMAMEHTSNNPAAEGEASRSNGADGRDGKIHVSTDQGVTAETSGNAFDNIGRTVAAP